MKPATVTDNRDAALAFFVEAFADENRVDPYGLYARMREIGSMVPTGQNMHLAFGHEACWSALRNPLASSDERRGTLFQREAEQDPRLAALQQKRPSLVFMDPPDHDRLRALVAKGFTPRRMEELRPDIQATTDRLLEDLASRAADGPIDIIDGLAYPLPIAVICQLLGVPAGDRDLFRDWSSALTKSVDPSVLRSEAEDRAIETATTELFTYCAGLLDHRRRHPGDDLLTALLASHQDTDHLRDDELCDLVTLLLVAGHETTVNLIGNGLYALLTHPDQLAEFHNHPEIAGNAIDELLRYDSPLQMVQRIATDDITLGGVVVPTGDQIIVMLGAANRDPAVFDDPDHLDLRRANANRHLSFGGGIHHCLGATLARVEGAIALTSLVKRFPHIALAGEPTMRNTFNLRGREHIPVSLGS